VEKNPHSSISYIMLHTRSSHDQENMTPEANSGRISGGWIPRQQRDMPLNSKYANF